MRTRKSIMKKEMFDYEAEENRPMCEGCNKLLDESEHRFFRVSDDKLIVGNYCGMYARKHAPKMMLDANECPQNYRRRRIIRGKVHVGQGKTKAGGNR